MSSSTLLTIPKNKLSKSQLLSLIDYQENEIVELNVKLDAITYIKRVTETHFVHGVN